LYIHISERCEDIWINSQNSEELAETSPSTFNPNIFEGTMMVENIDSVIPVCFTIKGSSVRIISIYFWARNFDSVDIIPNENDIDITDEVIIEILLEFLYNLVLQFSSQPSLFKKIKN
jgi:hypothetical protein